MGYNNITDVKAVDTDNRKDMVRFRIKQCITVLGCLLCTPLMGKQEDKLNGKDVENIIGTKGLHLVEKCSQGCELGYAAIYVQLEWEICLLHPLHVRPALEWINLNEQVCHQNSQAFENFNS